MKTVLIISYSLLHSDPRIIRQVQALKNNYKILTIGNTPINDDNIFFYSCNQSRIKRNIWQKVKKRLILYLFFIKNFFNISIILERNLNIKYILSYNIETPDVIIANDWNGLYLASELKNKKNWKAKIYFDAHEYAPKEWNSLKWHLQIKPLILYALKKCKADINIMSTVCDGIAREYEKFFNFPDNFVRIVTNAAEYNAILKPNEIGGSIIRLIHHGGATKERKLELMIKMMKYLDPEKYELNLMLTKADPNYYNYLLLKLAQNYKNINFIEPIPFSEITRTINNFDIGVYILKPDSFNHKYALPNKLFEFIQARLAIAIGPSIEMVKIVEHYNVGVHSKDFTPKSLAKAVAQLTPEKIMEYKRNTDKYARELSAEENINKIRNIIAELA
jgi:hypothetical protein